MKKCILFLSIIICLPLFAGVSDGFYKDPAFSFNSMINPNKIDMHHSLSFQSGISSSGDGYYINKYTNHMSFKLHPKLDFRVDLSLVNFGSMNIDSSFNIEGNNDNSSQIMPEFELEWRPSENMKINIGFYQGYGNSYLFDDEDIFDN